MTMTLVPAAAHVPLVQASEQAKGAVDEAAPNRKHAWSVLILAASAVLREGIESVIFLAGRVQATLKPWQATSFPQHMQVLLLTPLLGLRRSFRIGRHPRGPSCFCALLGVCQHIQPWSSLLPIVVCLCHCRCWFPKQLQGHPLGLCCRSGGWPGCRLHHLLWWSLHQGSENLLCHLYSDVVLHCSRTGELTMLDRTTLQLPLQSELVSTVGSSTAAG